MPVKLGMSYTSSPRKTNEMPTLQPKVPVAAAAPQIGRKSGLISMNVASLRDPNKSCKSCGGH